MNGDIVINVAGNAVRNGIRGDWMTVRKGSNLKGCFRVNGPLDITKDAVDFVSLEDVVSVGDSLYISAVNEKFISTGSLATVAKDLYVQGSNIRQYPNLKSVGGDVFVGLKNLPLPKEARFNKMIIYDKAMPLRATGWLKENRADLTYSEYCKIFDNVYNCSLSEALVYEWPYGDKVAKVFRALRLKGELCNTIGR